MVLLERTGLTLHQNPRKKDSHATQVNKVETTTAAAFLVNMHNPGQEKLIRAVIDSGSQSTYVSENVITHLKALPFRSETVIHALFEGSETKPKKHDIFPVEVWEKWNIIERVPDLELNKECHYLAHRPVIKLDSQTTKIRPVFDASASKRETFFNECLLKGTNLIELIPDILDRFRIYPIGISADMEKAFLMLSVAPKDRDFLRFFSRVVKGGSCIGTAELCLGVSSSSFLLNASVMHLLENCQPQHEEVAQKLKCSFYVDNCVSGVFNTDEQGRFIEHAKLIMLNGCFNLRGFERNVAGKNVDRSSGDTSVLGVIWNLETNTLKRCTDMDTLTCETKITKRLILAIVQKIFDPIGLLTPATLLPKLLIQHLWKMKIAWVSELSPNDVNVFLKWFRDLYILKDVTWSRCMIINSTSELHVFVDASKEACAASVFVRSMFKSDVKVTLVRAKARVAPLKPLSIPRLELMACFIGSRLANSIVNALNLPNLRITFWSDSTTALWRVREKGSWSVFLENRVKEIRQLTRGHLWKYVPGNLNIADLLSRGCSPQKMLISRCGGKDLYGCEKALNIGLLEKLLAIRRK
ncbi:DUF1758 domain-containing protein [Trichonephila clavipes]|nr:DUF1758 domain-containing protein [Trichonephila clavipes]